VEDNLILLNAPTSCLTLLDSDPDPDIVDSLYSTEVEEGSESDIGKGHYGYDTEDTDIDHDQEFWKRLLPSDLHCDYEIPLDPLDTNGYGTDTSCTLGNGSTDPLFDTRPNIETPNAIVFSSHRRYQNLFRWDFERFSFPSRQLKIAKAGHKHKAKGVKSGQEKKEQTEDEKGELERFKQEIRAALKQSDPDYTKHHKAHASRKSTSRRIIEEAEVDKRRQRLEDQTVADLLGEYVQENSISLLDMDNETPSKARGRGGYRWAGPVRDIETGRPVTPYKDDPDGPSKSSDGSSRKQTGSRGRPFPSSGPSRGRVRGGSRGRGTSPMPVGGIQPNLDRSTWVQGAQTIPPKASTRSLPSSASTAKTTKETKHHPSMPPGQAWPGAQPINNVASPYFTLISTPQARSQVPREQLHSQNDLQRSVMRSWSDTRADSATQKAIIDLLEWLSSTINLALCPYRDQRKGRRRFEVDVFGSVAWGGETGSSGDLDLVVLVSGSEGRYGLQLISV
jgi:hypothetical protein